MNRTVLPFVLSGTSCKVQLDPASLDSHTAGVAARFWAGKHAGSNAKAACVERIAAVWRDRKRVAEVLATLRPEERAVLAVVKRFGGAISGTLLRRELLARGVLRATGTCLTVQPNHEILLYLEEADGEVVTTLGRIAARESAAGLVQTFKLTRESVYGALEGGLTATAIESFLSSRSRTGLPANVFHSLAEWSRKREALVVRSAVAVGAGLPEGQSVLCGVLCGQSAGSQFVVASQRAASRGAKELHVPAESGTASRATFRTLARRRRLPPTRSRLSCR